MKKLKTLDTVKVSQQSDISAKILKQNLNYFAEYFYENINQCMFKSIFPSNLKLADVTPVYKKKSKNSKDNSRPVSIFPKFTKDVSMIKFDTILILYCPNINADFVEATTHSIV